MNESKEILTTEEFQAVFGGISRATAYGRMGDNSRIVIVGARHQRVIDVEAVQELIAQEEAEVMRLLEERVTLPRKRLANLIASDSQEKSANGDPR